MSELYLKKYLKSSGLLLVVSSKLSWFVSELPEKDIPNVVVKCIGSILYRLSLFLSGLVLPEENISNACIVV